MSILRMFFLRKGSMPLVARVRPRPRDSMALREQDKPSHEGGIR